ncbi:hypothetical protein KCP69_17570 [Salmonella enterica subsp. enterica]|nr:hypothetical protein KCP69_17570 [Salmonella enterica subsp. enterica]
MARRRKLTAYRRYATNGTESSGAGCIVTMRGFVSAIVQYSQLNGTPAARSLMPICRRSHRKVRQKRSAAYWLPGMDLISYARRLNRLPAFPRALSVKVTISAELVWKRSWYTVRVVRRCTVTPLLPALIDRCRLVSKPNHS